MRMRAGLYTYLAVAVKPSRAPNPIAITHLPWCRSYLDIPKFTDIGTSCAGIGLSSPANLRAISYRIRQQVETLKRASHCSPCLLVDLRVPAWAQDALAQDL